jgi:hypothetical protein
MGTIQHLVLPKSLDPADDRSRDIAARHIMDTSQKTKGGRHG